jgi:hypothetical protein
VRKESRNPRQVAAEHIYGERRRHQDRAHPEAPITMHPAPVRAGIGLAATAAAFMVVLVSGHLASMLTDCMGVSQATGIPAGAKEAAEKGLRSNETSEERSSGAKNLSVNSDCLPPADESGGELEQSRVAGFGLFEADEKFAVSVEPGVGSFYDPAARFGVWVAILDQPFFGA